ncbi:double-strand break repair helicase AddA [Vineibacter terrae]|uniref:double-strand break repair helicase AddA n=1 Tax=Vineibacter terrae TaxID=2586908 RepID=UPI002E33A305|nr:double-strand break repair helicase AddA [Vineibacter terrae]HEX2885413.1 double-strand break repair helicase AddA [Vineibacter terrae]
MSVSTLPIDPRIDAGRRQGRASDPHASAWVEANAGTGKTKVLTDRIVRLLLDGAAPQRILCLTFTKAAAAEMRNRLATLLGSWTLAPDDTLAAALTGLMGRAPTVTDMVTARRLFARVLDAPGGVSIQTIHSFCQALLQRFPLEAGVAPNFAVLDERQSGALLQEAQDAQLALLAGEQAPPDLAAALKAVAARIAEAEYVDIMGALLSERGRIARLAGDPAALAAYAARLRCALDAPADGSADDFLAAGCADGAFDAAGLRRAAQAMAKGSKTDRARSAVVAAWLADASQRIDTFETYLGFYFTSSGSVRSPLATAAVANAMPGIVEILTAEAERLRALNNGWRSLRLIELTAALLRLGADILRRYEDAKRARGALDYEDLVLRARALLGRAGIAAWVLYKLDGGIDHVLVDEAQDTNPDQWDVVRCLTEEFFAGAGAVERERTVFAVGDAKQSIFGFQRADPAKLAQMRQWFGTRAGEAGRRFEHVELISSYRSVGAVLDAVDLVFEAEPATQGVASASHPVRHVPIRIGEPGLVEVWPVVRPLEGNADPTDVDARQDALTPPDQRLAALIARHAKDLIARRERLANTGEPIHPGHIMVLVRRRNPFVTALVRAFKREALPVAGVDRMVLTDELPVQDLIALGQFVLLPQDDLNLACLLKSPLVGLDEEALFDLAWDRQGRRLWTSLQAKAEANDPRFTASHALLAGWLARADYTPPFEFFGGVLGEGRGREKLLERLGREAADPIDEFLSTALQYQRSETPSLQGFLRALELGGSDIKRDLDENRRREVRILTVHGSKGLQAPVVYLPDTCRVPMPLNRLLWSDDGGTLLWLPRVDDASDAARSLAASVKRRESQEQNRLLYVAMTRAADRLYVAGWAGARAPDRGCWHELVSSACKRGAGDGRSARAMPQAETFDFTSLLNAPDGWTGEGWRLASGTRPLPPDQPPLPLPDVSTLPGWARRQPPPEPQPPAPLAPSRPFIEDEPDAVRRPVFEPPPPGPFAPDRTDRFRRGNAIHRLLRVLPELPASDHAVAGQRLLQSIAGDEDDATRAAWLAETLGVLALPEAAALFGPDSRAEVPVVGMVALGSGPYAVSGQIDRLAVTGDAVLIVDFKTNRPPPRDPARVPLVYRRQMALYRALLSQIYPGKAVRCFLLWTDAPLLMSLPDAGLSAALP